MSITLIPPPCAVRVAVVTVSYGSQSVLGDFLASLPTAASTPLFVVVADNKASSGDTSVSMLAKGAHARYLPLADNRGYGHAVNEAVKILPPEIEWVVVSNPDIVVRAGAIDSLLRTVCADATIGAAGPQILSATGDVYPSARAIPSIRTGIGHGLLADLWPGNPWSRQYRREGAERVHQRDAGWLSGAFLIVRRSLFDELNGFDEEYFMYFEDVDLGYRIGRRGLRNVYEPSAVVVHSGAHSTSDESARMIRAHHSSARRFLFSKYPGPLLWPLRMVISAGLSLRSWISERRSH